MLLVVFLFFQMKKNAKETDIQLDRLENANRLLKYSLFQAMIFSQDKINDIVTTNHGETPLAKVIDMNTLIFRFSENACSPCLQRELMNVSLLEKQGIPILIIASYKNSRELQILLQKHNVKSRFILLEDNQELFPFEKQASDLYLFLLTPELNVEYLFFPVQTEDDLSSEYYNFIETTFKKNRK